MNTKALTTKQPEKETPSTLLRVQEEVKAAALLGKKLIVHWPRRSGRSFINDLLKNNG